MLSVQTLKITPEMLVDIAALDEFKGAWNALEDYTTALNLLGDVANFGQNFKAVLEPLQDKTLSTDILAKLYVSIARKDVQQAMLKSEAQGAAQFFRTEDMSFDVVEGETWIGALDTADPDDIADLTENLLAWLEKSLQDARFHPLLVIALFYAILLQISPFAQDNDKLAKLLVNILLLKSGYNYAPYIALDGIMSERSQGFYDALAEVNKNIADGRADFTPWILFFLRCLSEQKNRLEARMKTESKEITGLPALSVQILRLFENAERIQMREIMRQTRGRRSTIKLRLGELVEGGYLKRYGQARSTWYSRI
ncbi:MAG: Fic family protein [Alphaproteobacteria bacterium]